MGTKAGLLVSGVPAPGKTTLLRTMCADDPPEGPRRLAGREQPSRSSLKSFLLGLTGEGQREEP